MAFDALGGPVLDHHAVHVTVTFFYGDKTIDEDPYAELVIEGSDDNWASARFTSAAEIRRLRNVLTQAERRFG